MNVKKICKYAKKNLTNKDYIKCQLDGSIRKSGCPCTKRELSWWQKIKNKVLDIIIVL